MKKSACWLGLAAVVAAMLWGAHAAHADELYKSLLSEGYEIKSVVILTPDFTTRYGNKIDSQDAVVVTMQKGPSSAACYWYARDWLNQALADKKCNVFK
jgi:hypothetical protein